MKSVFTLFISLLSWSVWACPNCHEVVSTTADVRSPWTLIILGCFIALTYIPMYLFFRLIKKHARVSFDEN